MESKGPIVSNADYLRGLNDKEMAEWLLRNVRCRSCNAEYCDEAFCLTLIKELLEYPHKC